MKKPSGGGKSKGKGGAGGLGALAAALDAGAGGAGGPGGPPPGGGGPPPGIGGPPMGGPPPGMPPGAGGPPGMKGGGKVKCMDEGGKPHEDMPLRQARKKSHDFPADGGDTKEEKASSKGDFKYARGGGVHEKGRALDKPDGGDVKEEKATSKGDFKYARGGGIKGDNWKGGSETEKKDKDKDAEYAFRHGGHVKEHPTHGLHHASPPHGEKHSHPKAHGGDVPSHGHTHGGEHKFATGGWVTNHSGHAEHDGGKKGYHGPHGITGKGKTKGKYI